MSQANKHEPTRVLVIRAGALGDTVCASSIIEALRHHYGDDVIIDWVAKSGIGQLFVSDPRIDQLFELKSRNTPLLFNPAKWQVIKHSFQKPYDLVVNLELGNFFNNTIRLIRGKQKIGMPYRHFTEPAETHAVENLHLIYKSFLNNEDIQYAEPSLLGTPAEEIKSKFSLPDNYIVLVPANSHSGKRSTINHRAWPVEHWKKLNQLLSENNIHGVIIGGKGEREQLESLLPAPAGIISLIGQTNFPDLIGVIQGANAMITTDTGPSHLAAAVNTPVYAIIGPTNFKRTGPYSTKNNQVTILSAHLDCSPCYHTPRLAACQDNQCMKQVIPEQVLKELKASL
ncbi:MAG: glycosyltransferase family 9 protein [Gammaproteobacteria bacterium]